MNLKTKIGFKNVDLNVNVGSDILSRNRIGLIPNVHLPVLQYSVSPCSLVVNSFISSLCFANGDVPFCVCGRLDSSRQSVDFICVHSITL